MVDLSNISIIIIGILVVIVILYMAVMSIKNIRERNGELRKKITERDLLEKIHSRLGWALFWLFLILLAIIGIGNNISEELCKLRGGILC